MSRRGCSLPANASGVDPHRASITSRFGQVGAAGFQAQGGGDGGECASGRSSGGRQGCRVAQAGGDGLRHRGGTPAAAAAVHALRQGGGRCCCCCRCRRRPKGGAGGAATATPGQAPSAQPLVTTGRRLAGISGPGRCSDRKHPVGEHMSFGGRTQTTSDTICASQAWMLLPCRVHMSTSRQLIVVNHRAHHTLGMGRKAAKWWLPRQPSPASSAPSTTPAQEQPPAFTFGIPTGTSGNAHTHRRTHR
jgi:hypothetical protein